MLFNGGVVAVKEFSSDRFGEGSIDNEVVLLLTLKNGKNVTQVCLMRWTVVFCAHTTPLLPRIAMQHCCVGNDIWCATHGVVLCVVCCTEAFNASDGLLALSQTRGRAGDSGPRLRCCSVQSLLRCKLWRVRGID